MLGFFSKSNLGSDHVKKDEISFVSIPDGLPPEEIKVRFSQMAQVFANKVDSNLVFLNYGKDESIVYEYTI